MGRASDQGASQATLWPIGALVVCVFLWPAALTFDPGDWPSPHQFPNHSPSVNACGVVGAWCAYQLRYWVGFGTFPLLLFATLNSAVRLLRGPVGSRIERRFGLALLVAGVAAAAHLISQPGAGDLPVGRGGVTGFALGELLRTHLDRLGTLIVLGASLFVGLLFASEGWILKVPGAVKRAGAVSGTALSLARVAAGNRRLRGDGQVTAEESQALLPTTRSTAKRKRKSSKRRPSEKDEYQDLFEEDEAPAAEDEVEEIDEADDEWDDDEVAVEPVVPKAGKRKSRKRSAGPQVNFPIAPPRATEPYPREIENWCLPSLDLLMKPEYGFTTQQETIVRKQAQVLEQTLQEFRLDARVVEIDTGPVITMFELKLGPGIKVSQIASLSNDIARALKAHAIRVVAPISGKNTVGIEVPNTDSEVVRLHELLTLGGKRAASMGLPLFLGKDAGGAALVADLTKMPHLLIAGTTGSGKSVCLNTVILSLLMTQRPDHVKLILMDPKMVEMSQFKDAPHLMCPLVTDMARAEKILEWAVTKMEERYELLAEARVKNIRSYNALGEEELYSRLEPGSDEERARIPTHMPYVVIVIDELADLMMTAAKEVEHHLSRLAQKSRAVGIHIIVATQRPEAKIVTGLIKSNLPSRICFRVASRMDSRIVLDQNGGEVLLGQGDLLFLPPGSHKLIRAQGTFLEDQEIHAVLEDLTSRAKPQFHPELVRFKTARGRNSLMRDPLFDEAVGVVLCSKRGSVSLLQRRLTIGYSRASRLIDQMGEAGIVGDYKGSQAREVLMTVKEWEALQRQVHADHEAGYEADEEPESASDWDDTEAELVDSR